MIDRYNELYKSEYIFYFKQNKQPIRTYIPKPTDFDYKQGYITRHFITKLNNKSYPILEVAEVDVSEYFNNPFYITTSIDWKISKGTKEEVMVANRRSIIEGQSEIPHLNLYLPNLSQFYKEIDF